jgi:hypothetical protein
MRNTKEVIDFINMRNMKAKLNIDKIVDNITFEQLRTLLLWQEETEKK